VQPRAVVVELPSGKQLVRNRAHTNVLPSARNRNLDPRMAGPPIRLNLPDSGPAGALPTLPSFSGHPCTGTERPIRRRQPPTRYVARW
jgi:hypothetical protein